MILKTENITKSNQLIRILTAYVNTATKNYNKKMQLIGEQAFNGLMEAQCLNIIQPIYRKTYINGTGFNIENTDMFET